MNNANDVLEPPLKVGSGTIVRETCDVQTKVSVNFDDVPSNLRCLAHLNHKEYQWFY